MQRYFLTLIAFTFFLSCEEKKQGSNKIESPISTEENNNTLFCDEWIEHKKEYADSIWVKSSYNTCEPDWKIDLEIYINKKLIYTTDSLLEYQFNDYLFPTIIKNDSILYLLIERDDRPFLNKVDVFQIQKNKLDTIFSIPLFNQQGKDIDNDGIIEYAGYLDAMEGVSAEKTPYNPIFVYELSNNFIKFDSSATIDLNKKVYGDFYGFKQNYSILIENKKINNNWP